MEKIAFGLLVFIAVIALVGLVTFDSGFSGLVMTGNPPAVVQLKGDISDKEGYPLWSKYTKTQLLTSIVATDANGRVLGYGPLQSVFYTLTLYEDWKNTNLIFIKIGFYDAFRPERTSLQDCTMFSSDALDSALRRRQRFVSWDIQCDQFDSRVPARTRMYY